VSAEERVARIEWSRVHKASVKRILKDIAENNPELIRDAIIDGLQAPAPRSYPYLALAAAYLDGRPPDAESAAQPADDYSNLSDAELFERARNVTQRLKTAIAARVTGSEARQLPVIDAEVIPQPEPSK
jgi:hypothetical protein